MTNDDASDTIKQTTPVSAVVTTQPQAPTHGFGSRVGSIFRWTKIVLLVVMITLFVICVIQNAEEPADIKLITKEWTWHTSSAVLVGVSFGAGIVIALLFLVLRRGSRR